MENTTKKIYYISTRDVRKNRADAVHIMLTCQSFSNNGINVELITPSVKRDEYVVDKSSVFSLYGIDKPNFSFTELKTKISEINEKKTKPFRIVFEKFKAYSHFCIRNRKELKSDKVIVYSKCYISTLPFIVFKTLGLIKPKIVFEAITPKNSLLHRIIYKKSDKIISHLKFVTKDIIAFAKVTEDKIFEPAFFTQTKAVDEIKASKLELRKELKLKPYETYVLYAGKAGEKVKQVQYFIEAASKIPSLTFLIVGANNKGIKAFDKIKSEKFINNLEVYPFQPLVDYYKFVLASDILIGYYPPTHHNKYHLSPGKSGIYFASKNPCVFSDLPSLRSLFPEGVAFYAESDNVRSLVATINDVNRNEVLAKEVANNAYDFASKSSYDRFADSIIHFIYST
ncbi:MAG: hypothetical protein ACJAZK_000197 [Psychroserpens sp.]|uniref:hypothetical protein n=1 Tax=Psychroserpens sp. TaxID=2020870 RepID=UPI0039E595A9